MFSISRAATRWLAAGFILAVGSVGVLAAFAWMRYGKAELTRPEQTDALLDRVMPAYEVTERTSSLVGAPANITFAAATTLDLQQSRVIHANVTSRQLILGSAEVKIELPGPLLECCQIHGLGCIGGSSWPGDCEGSRNSTWESNVVFRALPPAAFAAFEEPGYVRIAWTLRADPVSANESIARTETRVTTTDTVARAKFRRYWAAFSPGILLIRRRAIQMVKREAEGRAGRNQAPKPTSD